MSSHARIPTLAALLLAAVLLAACPNLPALTPTPAAPTATMTPAPPAWIEHAAGDATLSLPADWEVLAGGDAAALFAGFQETDPDLAALIGSAEALQSAALWAYHTGGTAGGVTESVNVRRYAHEDPADADLAAAIELIAAQYRDLGFTVNETRTDLQIGGLPAAYIAYTLPFTRGGQETTLHGYQYLVTAAAETWILSYSAMPETAAALAPVFEQSAMTFKVK